MSRLSMIYTPFLNYKPLKLLEIKGVIAVGKPIVLQK